MHKILEKFYKGMISSSDALVLYLTKFHEETAGSGRPKPEIVQKYFQLGKEYVKDIKQLPFETVAVEERIHFDVCGKKFQGVIDYIGIEDGEYVIVDNKSRDLKPRSNRSKPTLKDAELDKMLRQLYIYAAAVKEKYGKFPKWLCFNCFKSGVFIKEEFDMQKYEQTVKWAVDLIEEIENVDRFCPDKEFFRCYYLCGMSEHCCYNKQTS